MSEKSNEYEANYKSALSYLKLTLKEQAHDCLSRAYAQIPYDQRNAQNLVYLDILDNLAILSVEKAEREKATAFIEEGLSVKHNHTDLLFLKSLLLMDEQRYDEMMEVIVHYLLSLNEDDLSIYNYKYTHEGALNEVHDNLLPVAYKNAFEYAAVRDIVERLCKVTGSESLNRSFDIMKKIDSTRDTREH